MLEGLEEKKKVYVTRKKALEIGDQFLHWSLIFVILLSYLFPSIDNNKLHSTLRNGYMDFAILLKIIIEGYVFYSKIIENKESHTSTKNMINYSLYIVGGLFCLYTIYLSLGSTALVNINSQLVLVSVAVFIFNFLDLIIYSDKIGRNDYMFNIFYFVLFTTGIILWYYDKNYMGIFAVLSLIVKGVHMFLGNGVKEKDKEKNILLNNMLPMTASFIALSILIMCYYMKIPMNIPLKNLSLGKVVQPA